MNTDPNIDELNRLQAEAEIQEIIKEQTGLDFDDYVEAVTKGE
jgi:hypothetical protein